MAQRRSGYQVSLPLHSAYIETLHRESGKVGSVWVSCRSSIALCAVLAGRPGGWHCHQAAGASHASIGLKHCHSKAWYGTYRIVIMEGCCSKRMSNKKLITKLERTAVNGESLGGNGGPASICNLIANCRVTSSPTCTGRPTNHPHWLLPAQLPTNVAWFTMPHWVAALIVIGCWLPVRHDHRSLC